jgi:hypothetical protein
MGGLGSGFTGEQILTLSNKIFFPSVSVFCLRLILFSVAYP